MLDNTVQVMGENCKAIDFDLFETLSNDVINMSFLDSIEESLGVKSEMKQDDLKEVMDKNEELINQVQN